MLTGVLTALKITGIVLLCILAFILFILLLILFVPIRYKVTGNVPDTELDNGFDVEAITFSARFHWLLHIVSGGIEFPDDKEFKVKVFGITVFPGKEKEELDDEDEYEEAKADESLTADASEGDKSEVAEAVDTAEADVDSDATQNVDDDSDSEKEADTDTANDTEGENASDENEVESDNDSNESSDINIEDEEDDKALIEILSDIFEKIGNILKTPLNVLRKIQYTISRACDKMDMIKTTLENDIFKRAYNLVKKKLIRLLKMILPDKTDIRVRFGTGDPADTAQVVAYYSAFYPFLYDKVRFEPDFDRKVVGTDVYLKGHITVFTVLYCVLVCYFNKDVKKVIKRFKKIFNS